jgi:hypothetical protein
MLSCLIVAGSMFLSGPYEAVRLDEIQQMELAGRTLRVTGPDLHETFEVTSYEAGRRPAQIVADCAAQARLAESQRELEREKNSLSTVLAPKTVTPKEDLHMPTPLEAECEEEHYRFGNRDVKMVREICAGVEDDGPSIEIE